MSTPSTANRSPGKRWRVALAVTIFAAIPVAAIAFLARAFSAASRAFDAQEIRRGQEDLDRQLQALKAGKGNSVHLYETRGTDELLRQVEGMAEVEELNLALTDVSDAGIASVATLPRLRKLVVYGGNRGVTDQGLAELKGKTSLESLELVNTRVTDEGLRVLQDLPNLRSLTLHYEPWRGTRLTDAGLVHLRNLPKLGSVTLRGRWASAGAVAELRAALPGCRVITDPPEQQSVRP